MCRQSLEDLHGPALEIAGRSGYAPREPQSRALFLFLNEKWDEYDALDFERRMLAAAYMTGKPELQERIREVIRRNGRTDLLGVVTGRTTIKIDEIDSDESEFIIRTPHCKRGMAALVGMGLQAAADGWHRDCTYPR